MNCEKNIQRLDVCMTCTFLTGATFMAIGFQGNNENPAYQIFKTIGFMFLQISAFYCVASYLCCTRNYREPEDPSERV